MNDDVAITAGATGRRAATICFYWTGCLLAARKL